MRWMKEHKLLSIIVGALLAAIIVLLVSFSVGKSGAANGGGFFNTVYNTLERPMTDVGSSISKNVKGFFSYNSLLEENKKLKEENEKLKSENMKLALRENELAQLKELSKALNYEFVKDSGKIVTADVVAIDGSNWTNILTINKGTESGIKAKDVVICGEGLVGRVKSTGRGWSKIVSVVDESNKISFKLENNLSVLGISTGSSNGRLSGYMLDSNAPVLEGDNIITSGMGNYPAGIKIGKIIKTSYNSNKQLTQVKIKPSVDFSGINKVTVVI